MKIDLQTEMKQVEREIAALQQRRDALLVLGNGHFSADRPKRTVERESFLTKKLTAFMHENPKATISEIARHVYGISTKRTKHKAGCLRWRAGFRAAPKQ